MKLIFSLIIFCGFVSVGCSTQNVLKEYKDKEIIFGSGGGFTGQVNEYHLDAKGNLKKIVSLSGNESNLESVKKSDLKKIFNSISETDLCNTDFNHPGNIYYFIREIGINDTCEVIWGDPAQKVPEGIGELYNLLMSEISK